MRLPRRTLLGSAAALAALGVLTLAMVPLRRYLNVADDGLVLIVPVVVGAALGGFAAGVVSLAAGFVAYDFVFIPPYYTPWVGPSRNWIAPGVYVIVMLVVSQVVASKEAARRETARQNEAISRLFEVSQILVEDKTLDELLAHITSTLRETFSLRTVAFVPLGSTGRAATAGPALSGDEEHLVSSSTPDSPTDLVVLRTGSNAITSITLALGSRPVGRLVLVGDGLGDGDKEAILTFANQTALAVERIRLREEAMRAELTGEVERLAKALVTAASHDLRSPLASIKTLASTLSDPGLQLAPERQRELAALIDHQSDRLGRLVANLLDMSRIQAGVLELRREPVPLAAVVREAVQSLAPTVDPEKVDVRVPDDLPFVDVDQVLIAQVVCNLVENAARHAPNGTSVGIEAIDFPERVEVVVSDLGRGVAPPERDAVFTMWNRRDSDGGAGLGLWIAKAFVEAHGETIWTEAAPGGGARFCFTIAKVPVRHVTPARPKAISGAPSPAH